MYKNYTKQVLRVMKITTVILFFAFMQVSASVIAQRLTLQKQDISLKQFFNEINRQTAYTVVWSADQVDGDLKLKVDFKNTPLLEVLDQALNNTRLSYSIENKTIIIKQKQLTVLDKIIAVLKNINIHGRITDNNGVALVGASVRIKNGAGYTATDGQGYFTLQGVDENAVLVISYIGYMTKQVKANADLSAIKLDVATSGLDSVSVIGYGTTTKRTSTNNILTINAATIAEQPVSNPMMALEGRTPGVLVTTTNGFTGSDISIQIRGINSISSGTGPLYIIDGVPIESYSTPGENLIFNPHSYMSPLSTLNPADIATIDVLKDADGTAIYGSRGANGVILITTKKGKKGATKFSVDYYSGLSRIDRFLDFLNTPEYLAFRKAAFAADGLTPTTDDAPDLTVWSPTANTDWQRLLYGKSASVNDIQASASGGDDNTRYFLGMGYHNEGSIVDANGYDKRTNFHLSLDHDFDNKKGNISATVTYGNDNLRTPVSDPYEDINVPPNMPVYNPDGSLYWLNNSVTNPLSYLKTTATTNTDSFVGNMTISYSLLPGLNLKMSANYTKHNQSQVDLSPSISQNPFINYGYEGASQFNTNNLQTYNLEPQLNYITNLGKGKLTALLGSTLQKSSDNSSYLSVAGFSSDLLLPDAGAASAIQYASTTSDSYKYASLFTRLTYNLSDEYIINGVVRRDGSSRFGPGKQYGDFWSLGGAWVFTQEKFISDNLPFLTFGKLRSSYGLVGNDQIADYQYLQTYTSTVPYRGTSSLVPQQVANPNYSWEVTKKLEVALELSFLKGRINFNTAWFENRSENQLVSYPLASQTGFTSYVANIPALVQNKGWEFELVTKNIKSKDFSWTTSFNFTTSTNRLLKFPGLANSPYSTSFQIGKTLNNAVVFNYTGVDKQTGLPTFTDVDKDGQISYPNDVTTLVSLDPKFYGGIGNTFVYKSVSLDVFLQFVNKKSFGFFNSFYSPPGFMTNVTPYIANNYWTGPGSSAMFPRLTTNYGTAVAQDFGNLQYSTGNITDASFLRVKNVSLSYLLPGAFVKGIGFDQIKFFVQCQNLFTFTKFPGGDPETGNGTPPLRTISTGFHFTF